MYMFNIIKSNEFKSLNLIKQIIKNKKKLL